ncbi:protein RRP5 homolog isoform X2 [Branchiostoma floridae]|nr:protein RRP5 homolog isoform X2 [Branchiostoma floridae]XP_035696386.1 protein RRP5 homolog isoform X2 [Branchiostoma floridae]XP_035696387.1 protein RRP5 homolog isoform X2 [Branchiostoma floridae]
MEEDAFPRGGTVQKTDTADRTTQKRRDAHPQDNLFMPRPDEKKKGKKQRKKKKAKNTKQEPTSELGEEEEGEGSLPNLVTSVQVLSYKKLVTGMPILGCVKEVSDCDLTVSLPDGLIGFAQITRISDTLTRILQEYADGSGHTDEDFPTLPKLYQAGAMVRCVIAEVVTSKSGHPRILLSLNPRDVNQGLQGTTLKPGMVLSGCVASIEDHGYTVDLGVKGLRAFLNRAETQEFLQSRQMAAPMRLAQPLLCLVRSVVSGGRSVNLTISPTLLQKAVAKEDLDLTLDSLTPGTLVEVTVTSVQNHGILAEFLGFTGSVSRVHLPTKRAELYRKGQRVKACILYIHPTTKTVGLSFQSRLWDGRTLVDVQELPAIGTVYKKAPVVHVWSGIGVTMKLSAETPGFAAVSQLSDQPVESIENTFKPGTQHSCRVINCSPLDGQAIVSLKKSVIEQPFLRLQDLKPGQVVEGKITSVQSYGITVSLSNYVRGVVSKIHLADIILKNPAKKFNEGDMIKCRVLNVATAGRQLALTHKRTLLTSKLPIMASYQAAKPGTWAHGFVLSVQDFGCIVMFYNNVKGLLPKREMTQEAQEDPRKMFYKGQVVKCRVMSCNPALEKLTVSLKPEKSGTPVAADFEVGKMVNVEVTEVKPDSLGVKVQGSDTPGFLPMMHLSDHQENCSLLLSRCSVGDVIQDAMYCCSRATGSMVTLKPSLKKAVTSGQVVEMFSDLRTDRVLRGWVRTVKPFGVFVEFPGGWVGLAPKAAVSDRFIEDCTSLFEEGQSVVAKVTEVDGEKQRFLVSLKPSDCPLAGEGSTAVESLGSLLAEREKAAGQLTAGKGADLSRQHGKVLSATVTNIQDAGMVLSIPDLQDLTAVASKTHCQGTNLNVGDSTSVRILHLDIPNNIAEVSLRPDLLEQATEGKKIKMKKGGEFSCTILDAKAKYLLVGINGSGALAYVTRKWHPNHGSNVGMGDAQIGERSKIRVVRITQSGSVIAMPAGKKTEGKKDGKEGTEHKAEKRREEKNRKRKRDESETREETEADGQNQAEQLQLGAIVNVVVVATARDHLEVKITGQGHRQEGIVHISEVKDDVSEGEAPMAKFLVGSIVPGRVIGISHKKVKSLKSLPFSRPGFEEVVYDVSLRESVVKAEANFEKYLLPDQKLRTDVYKEDQKVMFYLQSVQDSHVVASVSPGVLGKLDLLSCSDNVEDLKNPSAMFKPKCAYLGTITSIDRESSTLHLSRLEKATKLAPGLVVNAQVAKKVPGKLVLSLPFGGKGFANLTDLSDSYSSNPLSVFKVNQLLRCCVLECSSKRHVRVSLRPSKIGGKVRKINDPDYETVEDIVDGDIVRGYVEDCNKHGVFAALSHKVKGRVQYKHATSYFVRKQDELKKFFPVGKLVTAKVLEVSYKSSHLELSLLEKDTGAPDPLPNTCGYPLRTPKDQKEKKRKERGKEKGEKGGKKRKVERESDADDSGVEVVGMKSTDEEEESVPIKSSGQGQTSSSEPRLTLTGGFSWGDELAVSKVTPQDSESEEEDDTEAEVSQPPKKKSKKEREEERKANDKELYKAELALLDEDRPPQSADDFDRLVLSSPDSSILWLRYMAFHLHSTEIDKARTVAERALKTISFREEKEKLNVWVALMNLENMYGTEESLMTVFQRALQHNEALTIFKQLVNIYKRTGKTEEADQLYGTMVKRFRGNKDVWIDYGQFLMENKRAEAAHSLMQRSFKSLDKQDHVQVISRFAVMEFKLGDVERGRTMFENILSNYPKQVSIWSVYLEMLIKTGDLDQVRLAFDRVTALHLSTKNMKGFFKRYLEFEKKHGDDDTVSAVKRKAMEYVEARVGDVGTT